MKFRITYRMTDLEQDMEDEELILSAENRAAARLSFWRALADCNDLSEVAVVEIMSIQKEAE